MLSELFHFVQYMLLSVGCSINTESSGSTTISGKICIVAISSGSTLSHPSYVWLSIVAITCTKEVTNEPSVPDSFVTFAPSLSA